MKALRPFSIVFGADGLAIGSGFVLCAALAMVMSFLRNRHYVEAAAAQPVEFNHLLHVEGEGLECSDCHPFYEERISSGFPTAAMCSLCHLEPQGESDQEQRLVSLLEQGTRFEWESVFRQPPHVFFSHRRHVARAEIECVTCHGEIGSSERSPRERRPLGMQDCIDCHEREGGSNASNACTSCHR